LNKKKNEEEKPEEDDFELKFMAASKPPKTKE
jgi:hypothetical protein